MPEGVRLLDAMGVHVARSYPFHGIRYVDDVAGFVEARFRSGAGLGARRRELARALVERAASLGVRLLDRAPARAVTLEPDRVVVDLAGERLVGDYLAAADGLHSRLRTEAGLDYAPRSTLVRYGFRRHYRTKPWSRFVEVHWARGAEAYVTPVAPDEVGVAFLWHERAPSFEAMLARFPALDERLRGVAATTAVKGAGPFRRAASQVYRGRLALVGDAAGYVDAITGEGVALGFRGARELVTALTSGRGLAAYERRLRRLRRKNVVMAELALTLSAYPWLRRRVIGAFARRPKVFGHLVAATAAE